MEDHSSNSAIPFSFFVSLLTAIASVCPRKIGKTGTKTKENDASPTAQILQRWIKALQIEHSPLPPNTTTIFFRLLFPEEDVGRKYGLQETKIAHYLADILTVSIAGRGAGLKNWKAESSLGCLGSEVLKIIDSTATAPKSDLSIAEVDSLLTELAATCSYSSPSIIQSVPKPRRKRKILKDLYTSVSPPSAAFLTQIILKDLRPLLYPLPETHYTASLLNYNTKSTLMLTKEDVMKAWDPSGRMLKAYKVRASLDDAARAFEHPEEVVEPQLGVPISIPKCVKGQGCTLALKSLRHSRKMWAETKYDGERAQIHVEILDEQLNSRITIFSKSKRDSTRDRTAVHWIIRETLNLPHPEEIDGSAKGIDLPKRDLKFSDNIIIEAEMVAFSDAKNCIDEFWRIRSLIATTAQGPRHANVPTQHCTESQDAALSQCSMISNASDNDTRHLALVFFDILVLDSISLLQRPYNERRATLESIITLIPGYSMLVKRSPISLTNLDRAEEELRQVFAKLISDHEEGVVLKADEGKYNEWRLPWVKLKKDYIPGYGDTLDLVLVAAGWEKDRGRELRVAPEVFTTFYLGSLANAEEIAQNPTTRPHFEVFFTVNYGLTREKLEELNFMVRSSDPVKYTERDRPCNALYYTSNIFNGLPRPGVLLGTPILAEVFGAGFTKAPQNRFYELRFPRISKLFRSSERSYLEGATLQEFKSIALESVGRDRPGKDVDDWCNELWGKPSSPGVKSAEKRKRREEEWIGKLQKADGVTEHRVAPLRDLEGVEMRTPRPKKLRALGSVTNLEKALPTETLDAATETTGEEFARNTPQEQIMPRSSEQRTTSLPTPSRTPVPVPGPSRMRPLSVQTSPRLISIPDALADRTSSCYSSTHAPLDRNATRPAIPLLPSTLESGADPIGNNNVLTAFLRDAVVWLAKPSDSARPIWRAPSHKIIPTGQRVHTLDSFLTACGWTRPISDRAGTHVDGQPSVLNPAAAIPGCSWAEKGVIFIDDTGAGEKAQQWMTYPLRTLMERRSALLEMQLAGGRPQPKPVWIFSMKLLGVSELARQKGDIESYAICKVG